MLYQYINDDGKVFNLAPHNNFTIESDNIFTIIVGQNGTGKSRLLSSIIENIPKIEIMNNEEICSIGFRDGTLIKCDIEPNIIAISTSPFDKFPIYTGRQNEPINYHYLGLKDLYSRNFSRSYLSKIIQSLIDSLIQNENQIEKISNILNYLGYKRAFEINFEVDTKWKRIINNYSSVILEITLENQLEVFQNILRSEGNSKRYSYFYDEDNNLKVDKEIINLTMQSLIKMMGMSRIEIPNLLFIGDRLEVKSSNYFFSIIEISFMLEIGIIKLKEVFIQKIGTKQSLLLNDASSGEQSVIMSMLGIASKIENGSLICIDEPEVCLHPAWQEKYIQFLMNTFKDYKGCHFIIATHSPQITSKLKDKNCDIM